MVTKGQVFTFGKPVNAVKVRNLVLGGHTWHVPAENQPFLPEVLGETAYIPTDEQFVVIEAYVGVDGSWVVIAQSLRSDWFLVHFMQWCDRQEVGALTQCDPQNPIYIEVEVVE